jgi:hypothetical protein
VCVFVCTGWDKNPSTAAATGTRQLSVQTLLFSCLADLQCDISHERTEREWEVVFGNRTATGNNTDNDGKNNNNKSKSSSISNNNNNNNNNNKTTAATYASECRMADADAVQQRLVQINQQLFVKDKEAERQRDKEPK